ncbi:MAG: AmmeMemoRadiSam system protein B [candidate division KSB1 bacterium]|nr:AmmeMemoRadiSam system protein B [candidate division KSB1 bacterium]MDZ7275217.1 AmmeMemoRadiSam system protein B [candidate division KSB1 bacterium]MDZ7287386.1 AmmeMemoRadiSam system protein B [candidate division KSB1 bacterium]MDZ7299500.1 AmmeMemoRadiSam system protein B [candidate division KSB1 bacterium]MDZ7305454.1 AmmeMemoRadiSam system protein B [candidate division KSB1 bacterium]
MANPHKQYEPVAGEAVRAAAVAGMFYPENPQVLSRVVNDLLAQTQIESSPGRFVAGIAPHAGYRYSGPVAAHTYALLRHQPPATIVLIAPSHWEYFPFVSVFSGRGYCTPLGEVPVAAALAGQLIQKHENFLATWHGHRVQAEGGEHAIEVQLPFVQRVAPDATILPIVMGEQSWDLCEALGQALAELATETPLAIIASSDLSHYHNDAEARRRDGYFIELLQAGEPEPLYEALQQRVCEACGGGPIVAALLAARRLGAAHVRVLRYQNSGDTSGDYSRVVGYVAAAFERMP